MNRERELAYWLTNTAESAITVIEALVYAIETLNLSNAHRGHPTLKVPEVPMEIFQEAIAKAKELNHEDQRN